MAVRICRWAPAAGDWRSNFLTESLFLASLGGIAGFVGACCYCGLNSAVASRPVTRRGDCRRPANLIFTAVISLVTGILFGLGPLFGPWRESAGESLKQNNRTSSGIQTRLRSGLAVAQIAIASLF